MNILLLSSIYPLPSKDNKGTPVCHYFAREWVKMGHNVRVVHFQAVYPKFLYWIARLNRDKIAAKTGAVVYTKRDEGGQYDMDGVSVFRIPLFKPFPHGKYSKTGIRNSISVIVNWLREDGFTPDCILGHFLNPQVEIVSCLKKEWPQSKSAVIIHLESENLSVEKLYGKRFKEISENIDFWGFRNEPLRRLFEKEVMPVKHSFICYSGIPSEYITNVKRNDFKDSLKRFVYVGEMIERKYPIQVLEALEMVYPLGECSLTYVGQGALLDVLKKRIEQDGLSDYVRCLGKIPRDNIKKEYDNADCMVMISKGEAYGLVYLEAMARGCITIASRNEGFDGVIKDGVNGFLCEAGNANELAAIIRRINGLSPEERLKISDNAIATARNLTDENAARMYINDLFAV